MDDLSRNAFIASGPARPARTRLLSITTVPCMPDGHRRSLPRGVVPSSGTPTFPMPTERPMGVRASGVSIEAAAEPENRPTLEPKSPI